MTTEIGTLDKGHSEGWNLLEGYGVRNSIYTVKFATPFGTPPKMTVSLYYLEIDSNYPSRIRVTAENITVDSFDVRFHTWDDSKIAAVGVTWIAIEQ